MFRNHLSCIRSVMYTPTLRTEEITVQDGQKAYSAKETKDGRIYRSALPSVIHIPILRLFALM